MSTLIYACHNQNNSTDVIFKAAYTIFIRVMDRYLQSKDRPAWALVTRASDGIGLGFAQELSERGFNIILHGRNEGKLDGIKEQLQKTSPDREFRIFVRDAEKELTDEILHNLQESLKDIHLTVLINNVGGSGSVEPV